MSLVVQIGITAGRGLEPIETVEIRRIEPLTDPRHPDDEVHPYAVTALVGGASVATARIEHRYGDGARACVRRALTALYCDPDERCPDCGERAHLWLGHLTPCPAPTPTPPPGALPADPPTRWLTIDDLIDAADFADHDVAPLEGNQALDAAMTIHLRHGDPTGKRADDFRAGWNAAWNVFTALHEGRT